ncbi:MAG: hypothetical protein FWG70_09700 [Oscillospiraceae bacterium]|nr:hypothetical protein [Oscillospiraceae bacterium]
MIVKNKITRKIDARTGIAKIVIFSTILVIVSVAVILINSTCPFLKPIQFIERDILRITPLGMSREEVIIVLKNSENWLNVREDGESIKSHSKFVFPYIGVTWEFDENGGLININIIKYWTP